MTGQPPGGQPQGPGGFSTRVPAQFPAAAAAVRHKQQSLWLPVVFIVLGALGSVFGLLGILDRPVAQSLLAIVPWTILLLLGVWFLNFIDRWEPEPPHFVIAAFLWGAGVSAFISAIVNTVVLVVTEDRTVTAMFSAPLIEESTKGLFLVVVLLATRRGRAEFNSLTDAIVYGGMVGLGFAWVEHISYVLMAETWDDATMTLIVRLIFTSYLHPILTIIVSIGIWKGVNAHGAMRFGWPFIYWLAAVVLHFLHNGSTELMGAAGLFVVGAIELVTFISLIVMGVRAKRREHAEIRRQLPAMVHFGWITPLEAGWLADKDARRAMISQAGDQGKLLKDFIQNCTELALLRGRLDAAISGMHPRAWLQLHGELTELVSHQRPIVDSILRGGRGWAPIEGQPGRTW